MKVLMINMMCGIRSTGRICTDLAEALESGGHEVKIAYGRDVVPEKYQKYSIRIGNDLDVKLHGALARCFDFAGFGSKKATDIFLKWVEAYDPDIIHLHNIHGYYINIKKLFEYIKRYNKKVIWTLHDCWNFTGHCSYFSFAKCDKWMNKCGNCPQKKEYPASYFLDRSQSNYINKKKIFSGVKNMTLVTPSSWLANLIGKSFLKTYPVVVIPNGIDTKTFCNVESTFKIENSMPDKKIVLGVAAVWNARKGLDDFINLRSILPNEYVIVLVGLSDSQIQSLPSGIIGITHTNSTRDLAELYSCSDVFVNPTYEDNYPTTNLEAISCGTPVVTYNTGGSVESAIKYGSVVEQGDIEGLKSEVIRICQKGKSAIDNEEFDIQTMVSKYIKLYLDNEEVYK